MIALGGIPLGYLLARVSGRAVGLLGFLVQLPLALPPLASGILLLFLVGYATPIGRLTGGALTDSFAGIVLAEVFVAAPFLIIAARSAFAAMDPGLEGVAATLGRGPLYVFFHVSMPIARPAILSGLLLAWLRAFGEFGATVMVAYHPYSLPVYTYVAFGSQGLPAMLPVLRADAGARPRDHGAEHACRQSGRGASGRGGIARRVAGRDARYCRARSPQQRRSVDLALQLQKRLGNFQLDVAWSPQARRLAIVGPSGSGKSLTLKMIAGIERLRSRQHPARRPRHRFARTGGARHRLCAAKLRPVSPSHRGRSSWRSRPAPIRIWPSIGSIGSACAASNTGSRMRSRSASSNASRWRARWCALPVCCCSTSRSRRSTRRCARGCAGKCWRCKANLAATTILVTHDPAEAAMLADEILVFENGRVLQSGPTDQVFRRPNNETVARLLGADHAAKGIAVGAR